MTYANHTRYSRAGDDDANDNIDSDTPRSGVATPKPDPADKRLPGIMHSYFGQVGSGSSTRTPSGPLETPGLGTESEDPLPFHRREDTEKGLSLSGVPNSVNESECTSGEDDEPTPLLSHELPECIQPSSEQPRVLHPYPTPPISSPPSLRRLKLSSSTLGSEGTCSGQSSISSAPSYFAHRKSISDSLPAKARRASVLNPLSSVVTASSVHAVHFSNPCDRYAATTPNSPTHSRVTSNVYLGTSDSISYGRLKRLTDDAGFPREKSTPGTPTRALSNQTSASDTSGGAEPANGGSSQTSAPAAADIPHANTTNGSAGAPVKAARGKLTVKIAEARGLRRSKDPYVVAVFQRNELVSKGPRMDEDDDEEEIRSPAGAISMSRQGSESGRPPMAIPMKSRQSSSTSLTDYRDFKIRTRKSMNNPKWDTEAVL